MSFDHSYQDVGIKPLNGPVVRLIDFSDNIVVRQVSTMLRRLWLVDPPLSDEELLQENTLKACFQAITQAIGNGISDDPEEARWDHGLWLSHTELRVLNPAVLAAAEPYDVRSVVSPWRSEIYEIYKHVFIDLWRMLKEMPETGNLGKFDPSQEGSVTLGVLKAEKLKVDKTAFRTDTFLYPVWINPKAKITFSVDGVEGDEHVWSDGQPSVWAKGLWVQGEKEITMTTKLDNIEGDQTGITAVFVMGHCEKAPLIRLKEDIPDQSTTVLEPAAGGDGQSEDDDRPEFVPEADHLARAVFLKAGNAVEQCAFDIVDTEIDQLQDTISWLEVDVQESDSVYEPLPNNHSIRVLIVEPESAGPDLQTRLEVVDLDKEMAYEAMSYTWGDPKDQVPLQVRSQTVMIPGNLENALKRLRHADRRRYVWADAVCINQADLSERGQQVSIMRRIYSKARRVLVWLGQDKTNYAKLAFTTICDIVRSWRPADNPHKFSSYKEAFEPQKQGLSIDEDGWTSLQAMFQAEYFTRFWVIQELVLGQNATVVWGSHSISWGLVGISAAWLLTRGWATKPDWPISAAYNAFLIYVLPLARRSAISSFSKLDLSAVLATTMGKFKSTDPRDRIFALLGMPFSGNDPETEQLVSPDYTANVKSVYLSATKRMLSHDANLRLLSAVQHGPEVDRTSPSWVPKWDQPLFAEPLALRQEHGYYANAGELFTPDDDDTFGADGESLALTGLKVTAVTDVTEPFTAGKISFSSLADEHRDAMLVILSYLNDPDRQVRSSWSATLEKFTVPGYSNPEKQARALASGGGFRMAATTGMPGKYGMRESTEILDGEKMGVDNLGEFLLYWRERCTWDVEALRHDDFKDFWAAVEGEGATYATERALCSMNAFLGRRVFRCEDGKLGLGPAAMRPGDVVVVLFGGIVPYVLRPLEGAGGGGDGQNWAFVGECIVPTIMQGQAVEEAGLLADGTYERETDGTLRLKPSAPGGEDPRFHREVGKNGVERFEIR
ncbi:putative heterokaryon incompatibility [Diaporthe ampelina]|uniref:Putative heterokaryon incompatibility n=1 Tax=Diaporthe ampelina TaxID=1214573 RepID=A0A0G2FKY2_9PEZI|nr:putative heterokaryon incompatibility [Diaporthe ampelina]